MIYVIVPLEAATGGGESLHQLAAALIDRGQNVSVVYSQSQISFQKKQPINVCPYKHFEKYAIPVAETVEDSPNNILIVPEVETHLLHKYHRIKKVIWWLSLTFFLAQKNYYTQAKMYAFQYHRSPFRFPIHFAEALLKGRIKPSKHTYNFRTDEQVFHLYNCEYVHEYLRSKQVPCEKMLYLCGPIDQIYFDYASTASIDNNRKRIVVFNPAKDIGYAQAVIEQLQKQNVSFELIPIVNMTKQEIANLLKRARVYMDFGYFPGPERMPREAVSMGCNIITSRNGAAKNQIDVPIPDEMKIDTTIENIPIAAQMVQALLDEYTKYRPLFDKYRAKVLDQRSCFTRNVSTFLELIT